VHTACANSKLTVASLPIRHGLLSCCTRQLVVNLKCAVIVSGFCLAVQSSATFKYLNLRCRGEAPDSFQEHLSAAMAAHKTLTEQQALKQLQHQQQQAAGLSQQSQHSTQQQQAAPWTSNSAPVSHPISGALTSGSFTGPVPPGALWVDTANQQQQQVSGGGLPPRSPQTHRSPLGGRGLQAVDGELLSQLVDMVRCCCCCTSVSCPEHQRGHVCQLQGSVSQTHDRCLTHDGGGRSGWRQARSLCGPANKSVASLEMD
jgi:hypothetical protein